MKLSLPSSCILFVFIMLFIKQFETAGQKRLFQKINDLEIEMRQENVRRQLEIRGLQQSMDRMEEQLNNTVSILDKSLSGITDKKTVGTQTVNDRENVGKIGNGQIDSGKVEEVLGAFMILKRGLSEEKKETIRLRRHVDTLQSQLHEQRNVSKELSKGVASILNIVETFSNTLGTMFEVLNDTNLRSKRVEEKLITLKSSIFEEIENAIKPLSNDIKGVQNDIADVKESGMSILLEINNTNQRSRRIDETLQSDVTNTLDNLEINNNTMYIYLNKTASGCNEVHEICDRLELLHSQLTCSARRQMSCRGIFNAGCRKSNVYSLTTTREDNVSVYCDQKTDGGGWIVFQRRQDGSVDFFRDWADYKNGFGSLTGEFWLGNDNIYRLLTTTKQYELRIDMGDFEGNSAYAKYSTFRVGPESEGYKLEVGGYSGNAGDSLEYHNGRTFKTKDRDDRYDCSEIYKGGWWYGNCHHSNLNGVYNRTSQTGVIWRGWKGIIYSLRFVEMKFREIT